MGFWLGQLRYPRRSTDSRFVEKVVALEEFKLQKSSHLKFVIKTLNK